MNGWLPSPINWRPGRRYEISYRGDSWPMTGLFTVRDDGDGPTPFIDSDVDDELVRLPLGAQVTDLANGVALWRAGRPAWFDDSEEVDVVVELPIFSGDGSLERIDVHDSSVSLPRALLERPSRHPDEPPYGAEFFSSREEES